LSEIFFGSFFTLPQFHQTALPAAIDPGLASLKSRSNIAQTSRKSIGECVFAHKPPIHFQLL
jgi:hypothetical protein